ncbi:hypothetical protein R3P38DRAFT_3103168 [Favolaschia claudopus]|uniref:Uncharacterized protein n=1 Tax=Favolaschia claudopus TaxID=2862362 RepID=A0AAV9ZKR1_9AGAR
MRRLRNTLCPRTSPLSIPFSPPRTMATTPMQDQVEIHRANLASTTNFRVFPVLVETALYAIFTVLISVSSYLLLSRGLRSRSNKVMLAITLTMYLFSTWEWALDIHFLRDDLKVFLPADLIQPPPDHTRRMQVNTALHIAQGITNNINVILSDMVVCWRVWVVYGRNRRVMLTAISFLILLASAIFLCNLTQIGEDFPGVVTLHRLVPSQLAIDVLALALSALINLWATIMIGYQAWRCRRNIRRHFADVNKKTFAEGMMTLFIESGVIYTVLWILKNIIIIPQVEPTAYTNYANVVMYQVTGMYPTVWGHTTVLVVLVALRKSQVENQFKSYHDADTDIRTRRTNSTKPSSGVTITPSALGLSGATDSNVALKFKGSRSDVGSVQDGKLEH